MLTFKEFLVENYYYHTTKKNLLDQIRRNGLSPQRWNRGRRTWLFDTDNSFPPQGDYNIQIRFSRERVRASKFKKTGTDPIYDPQEYYTQDSIPREYLEYRMARGNKWSNRWRKV